MLLILPKPIPSETPFDELLASFTRSIYPEIVTYYESEEGERAFREWQKSQALPIAEEQVE